MANKEKKENTLVHDTICLFLITLIAGICLGGVNKLTESKIKEQEEIAKNEAYEQVYEGADFKSDKEINKKLKAFQKKLAAGTVQTASGEDLSDVEISEVLVADKGGYVATVSGKGYGGAVKLAVAIDSDGSIIGIRVTDCSNETPGLGQNSSKGQDSEEDLKDSFIGQYLGRNTSDEVSVDKDGGDIEAISGATITSRAVTRAVNGVLLFAASLSE
ncbi:MAG: RnfABCDGE type electron transport complex subunit G [Clostridiaceae bacterium]|nr:RnfABCDGE type electron transport complex subunit G [Clostridiaceae bacterium]